MMDELRATTASAGTGRRRALQALRPDQASASVSFAASAAACRRAGSHGRQQQPMPWRGAAGRARPELGQSPPMPPGAGRSYATGIGTARADARAGEPLLSATGRLQLTPRAAPARHAGVTDIQRCGVSPGSAALPSPGSGGEQRRDQRSTGDPFSVDRDRTSSPPLRARPGRRAHRAMISRCMVREPPSLHRLLLDLSDRCSCGLLNGGQAFAMALQR